MASFQTDRSSAEDPGAFLPLEIGERMMNELTNRYRVDPRMYFEPHVVAEVSENREHAMTRWLRDWKSRFARTGVARRPTR